MNWSRTGFHVDHYYHLPHSSFSPFDPNYILKELTEDTKKVEFKINIKKTKFNIDPFMFHMLGSDITRQYRVQ